MLREIRRILRITGRGRRFMLLLLLRSPFDFASTLNHATFLQRAFNSIGQKDAMGLTAACLTFGVASLLLFLYNGIVWSVYAPFCTRMEGRLRIALSEKIASLSYERISSLPQGDWLTRLNSDVEAPFSRGFHFPHAACAVVNIAVSATILLNMNPAVFGLVLLFVVPHILISQLFIARAMLRLHESAQKATANNMDELSAQITCADIAALYDGNAYLLKRFEESSLRLMKAKMKIVRRTALSAAVLPLFGIGGYLTLLLVSSGWIAQGQLSFGDLTAAFQYRGGVLVGSNVLISCLISIQGSMAGMRRINATMSEQSEEEQHG